MAVKTDRERRPASVAHVTETVRTDVSEILFSVKNTTQGRKKNIPAF